ncbi:MAG: DUF2065 domain-containing protein [Deltaproteobacteria bacterium]
MSDLIVGAGLVLVFEGLMWALAPQMARHLLDMANQMPQSTLRASGWTAVAGGLLLVWLVRG